MVRSNCAESLVQWLKQCTSDHKDSLWPNVYLYSFCVVNESTLFKLCVGGAECVDRKTTSCWWDAIRFGIGECLPVVIWVAISDMVIVLSLLLAGG